MIIDFQAMIDMNGAMETAELVVVMVDILKIMVVLHHIKIIVWQQNQIQQ